MKIPKIIIYTPEMLLKDNLRRGVREELLLKQNFSIESIKDAKLKTKDKESDGRIRS